ncbi:MAG: alkaline phosphatase family protein [Pseudomonadales bacterium]|nr:alkaline phosphatase family protein [Pseudomonadales bacterium]
MSYRNIYLSMMMSSTLILTACGAVEEDESGAQDQVVDTVADANDAHDVTLHDVIEGEVDSSESEDAELDVSDSEASGSEDSSIGIEDTSPVIIAAVLNNDSSQIIENGSLLFTSNHYDDVWLYVGSSKGGNDIYSAAIKEATSINDLPQDGSPVFVSLWTKINGQWQQRSYEFSTANTVINSSGKIQKVLVLGLDGVQFEKLALANTPHLDALNISRVYAGGVPDSVQQQQTYSGPGWSSIMTGVWADQHKIINNNAGQSAYTSVLARLEQNMPDVYTASIWQWPNVNNQFFADDKNHVDSHQQNLSDAQVISATQDLILNQSADVIFAALDDTDTVGHSEGFSQNYINSLALADSRLGELLETIESRKQSHANEDWLILVTTDHGRSGSGFGHGGQSEQERTSFIASNKTLLRSCSWNESLLACPSQVDIAPTVFEHMQLAIEPSWKLAGQSLFSVNAVDESSEDQSATASSADVSLYRHWAVGGPSPVLIPESSINGLTQINGQNVAHLRAQVSAGSYTEMSVPLNPYISAAPFSDPAVDLSDNPYRKVTITYQSNHPAILQLRQSGVHGGSHNQAVLPASPDGFISITLILNSDFLWLGHSASTLDVSKLGKFNFAFLSQNEGDGYAEIIISGLHIQDYQPQD